jgi:hypothetical protein
MQAAAAAGSMSDAQDRWGRQFAFQQQTAGLEGLGSLYSAVPNEYMQNKQFDLSNRDLYNTSVGNYTGMHQQNNPAFNVNSLINAGVSGGLYAAGA